MDVYGDIISDAVQLRRTDGKATSPSTGLLYSRVTSASASPQRREFTLLLYASGLRVFSIGYLSSPDYRLSAAETSAPGAQQGVVYDPRGSLERIWKLLHVSGLAVPGLPYSEGRVLRWPCPEASSRA